MLATADGCLATLADRPPQTPLAVRAGLSTLSLPASQMVNAPKTIRTFCKAPKCRKHETFKITQYKAGKASLVAQGACSPSPSPPLPAARCGRSSRRVEPHRDRVRERDAAAATRHDDTPKIFSAGLAAAVTTAASLLRLPMDLSVPALRCFCCGPPWSSCTLLALAGKRRYDRKQAGFGGQTKPVFHKKVRPPRTPLAAAAAAAAGGAEVFVALLLLLLATARDSCRIAAAAAAVADTAAAIVADAIAPLPLLSAGPERCPLPLALIPLGRSRAQAKTTKKITLKMTCSACKAVRLKPIKRAKHFEICDKKPKSKGQMHRSACHKWLRSEPRAPLPSHAVGA